MVTNLYVKFNYDPLSIDKALGNFRNNNNKNNVRSVKCILLQFLIFAVILANED